MTRSILLLCFLISINCAGQLRWINADAEFSPLPSSVHVFKTTDSLDGKPNIAYYLEADLHNKNLQFTTDTTRSRRITPSQFYEKENKPLVVVNCAFFSYETNSSLNVIIREGKFLGYNSHTLAGKGKDTLTYRHPLGSALGISSKRKADVAWLFTDSTKKFPYAQQTAVVAKKDSLHSLSFLSVKKNHTALKKWKMQTAVGGGPVLLQNGEISISNNEEIKFAGKAIDDKHPRTAMGYTADGKLIILVIEGRHSGKAEGATLTQEAQILKDIDCTEALNLDGGGSSCMLVNGKETIQPSEKGMQRPVPAIFMIRSK